MNTITTKGKQIWSDEINFPLILIKQKSISHNSNAVVFNQKEAFDQA